MSERENLTKPFLQPLLMGERSELDAKAQATLAVWAVKTAMVLEALDAHDRHGFTPAERERMRSITEIPWRTSVWLAASVDPALFLSTKNRHLGVANVAGISGVSITVALAHAVLQVLRIRVPDDVGPQTVVTTSVKPAPWDRATVQIWPPARTALISWPPPMGLNGEDGLNLLAERFSTTDDGPLDTIVL
jgi:hypothetical protein